MPHYIRIFEYSQDWFLGHLQKKIDEDYKLREERVKQTHPIATSKSSTNIFVSEDIKRGLCFGHSVLVFKELCTYFLGDGKEKNRIIKNIYLEYTKKNYFEKDNQLLNPLIIFNRFFQLNEMGVFFQKDYFDELRTLNQKKTSNLAELNSHQVYFVSLDHPLVPTLTADLDIKIMSSIWCLYNDINSNAEHIYPKCTSIPSENSVKQIPTSAINFVNKLYSQLLISDEKSEFEFYLIETQSLLNRLFLDMHKIDEIDKSKTYIAEIKQLKSFGAISEDDYYGFLNTQRYLNVSPSNILKRIRQLLPYKNLFNRFSLAVNVFTAFCDFQFTRFGLTQQSIVSMQAHANNHKINDPKTVVFSDIHITYVRGGKYFAHSIVWWIEQQLEPTRLGQYHNRKFKPVSYIFDSSYGFFKLQTSYIIVQDISAFYKGLLQYILNMYRLENDTMFDATIFTVSFNKI